MAFGAWVNRANAVQLRSQGAMMGLGPAIQQINASGAAPTERLSRMRTVLQQALAVVEASGAQFEELDTPEFPLLDLSEDLRPLALKRQMLVLNHSQRGLLVDILHAFEVGMANPATFRESVQSLFRNIAAIYDSQILLARARMESAPRDSSERAILSFELSLLRGMYRLLRAYSPFDRVVDRGLPADVAALADDIDAQIQNGETRLAAELAALEGELAGGDIDNGRAALLRRTIAVISITRDYFPAARRLSAHFRALSQSLRGQVLTEALLSQVVGPLRQFRFDMDAVTTRQNQVLAATP